MRFRQHVGQELLLVDSGTDKVLCLNPTAKMVLLAIESGSELTEVSQVLAKELDLSTKVARELALDTHDTLVSNQLLLPQKSFEQPTLGESRRTFLSQSIASSFIGACLVIALHRPATAMSPTACGMCICTNTVVSNVDATPVPCPPTPLSLGFSACGRVILGVAYCTCEATASCPATAVAGVLGTVCVNCS